MKTKAEVIAMLLPDSDGCTPQLATLLLRDADGRMSLETVNPDSTLGHYAMSTGCFRPGQPIVDPVTRQVLGYEMEMIDSPLARFA